MAYLRYYDYSKTIQDVNLQQIINADDNTRLLCEQTAQATAIEHLKAKYDTDLEFTNTVVWSPSVAYAAGTLVELNYAVYDPAKSYVTNNLVTYSGSCYICTGNTGPIAFDPTKWTLLGKLYDLFYVTYPKPYFWYKNYYNKGDQVFYVNKIYTALIPTMLIDQQTALQYGSTDSIPYPNVFPDSALNGLQYWGAGTAYSVTAGTLPTDTSKWTKGDNRNPNMVRRLVQICLYYLHDRIAQRNMPEVRSLGYAEAMAWLDMAKTGEKAGVRGAAKQPISLREFSEKNRAPVDPVGAELCDESSKGHKAEIVVIDAETWEKLTRIAADELRTPEGQALYFIRSGLASLERRFLVSKLSGA